MHRVLADFSGETRWHKMQNKLQTELLGKPTKALSNGPLAMIFVEDQAEIGSTIRHHLNLGFAQVMVFMPDAFDLPGDVAAHVQRISFDISAGDDYIAAVNAMLDASPGRWMYYCFNTEYLFYPFCESRTIGEMLAFQTEERRDAMISYVIDLYVSDLEAHPNSISLEDAHLDKSGYYALARNDPNNHNHPKERQLDFFGGLRWRYEEHIPPSKRKIDRIALFKSKPGLKLLETHIFNDEEYNTYSCPWHHNLSTAIASFRTAKALKCNPGSSFDIPSFTWHNSTRFKWHSKQLLDLGLMEPGQWF
jgi:hypothetical protein